MRAEKGFTTILMDMDGTFLDFDQAERQGVCQVLRAWGIEPSDYLIQRYHGINQELWKAFERGEIPREEIFSSRFRRLFAGLGRKIHEDQAAALYRRTLGECAFLMDGAAEICQWLKAQGYLLYVVTNGVAETQRSRLRLSGLEGCFRNMFVSEDTGSQKPQKAFFDYCFARIPEKDPSRFLIVGDSLTSDIRGGQNAGIATCWVNDGSQPHIAGIRADYEIRGLRELKAILEAPQAAAETASGAAEARR